jgi:hypothetical protein
MFSHAAILPDFGETEQGLSLSHMAISKRREMKNTHSLSRRAKKEK